MVTAVFPGSFDPITRGHLDMIQRASRLVDRLIVAVMVNTSKQPLFTMTEKVAMISDELTAVSYTHLTLPTTERV